MNNNRIWNKEYISCEPKSKSFFGDLFFSAGLTLICFGWIGFFILSALIFVGNFLLFVFDKNLDLFNNHIFYVWPLDSRDMLIVWVVSNLLAFLYLFLSPVFNSYSEQEIQIQKICDDNE